MKLFLNNRVRKANFDESSKVLDGEIAFINLALQRYDALSDEEKYELIDHFFAIRFDTKDFLDYINAKQGTEFKTVAPLRTRMETTFFLHPGEGDLSKLSKNPVRINYEAAISDDFFPKSKPYGREEIVDLIERKKLYPIKEETEQIETFDAQGEPYHKISTLIPDELKVKKESFVKDSYVLEELNNTNRELIHTLVSQSMPQKQLLSNIKYYLEDILAYYKENERRSSKKDKENVAKTKVIYDKHFPVKKSRY